MADLVAQVKEMQKTDPQAKQQWHQYCTAEGGGVKDPAKHEASFLETFISNYNAGMVFQTDDSGDSEDKVKMVELFKMGQKKSAHWKSAWQGYCKQYGGGNFDPSRHDEAFMSQFFDYLGKGAVMTLKVGSMWGPMGGMAMMGGMGGRGGMMGGRGGGPAAKRRKTESSGDAEKDALVERIKKFQRASQDQKEQWWNHADANLGNVRDPVKHDASVLEEFCNDFGVP
eukprot:TRINITY_DN2539_c1_g1_i2.p1 TRINITY_DN2539_c1_g1~~TRINITY_DN2539_c1_g1_i2.p1  ORF type:complete len:227 (-),score=74.44 TRINITY_DN2539_c1_g1_i2:357-1037(-)